MLKSSGAVDAHRLAEERSLAYHELVGERLLVDPTVRERAASRVERWAEDGSVHPRWVETWRQLLTLPPAELKRAIVARTEEANALRQVTPFAGAIDPRTRWKIWRTVRERMNAP